MPFLVRCSTLDYSDVNRSKTFLTLLNIKRYTVTLTERLEAARIYAGMVDKCILTLFLLDKSKTFRIVKPLYGSLCHFPSFQLVGIAVR